jgi:hypothetical protein
MPIAFLVKEKDNTAINKKCEKGDDFVNGDKIKVI